MTGPYNPHAWMSPLAARVYVDNIAAALADLAPEHADAFAAHAEAYKAELDALHTELVTALDGIPANRRALVTCEARSVISPGMPGCRRPICGR